MAVQWETLEAAREEEVPANREGREAEISGSHVRDSSERWPVEDIMGIEQSLHAIFKALLVQREVRTVRAEMP